MFNLVRKLLAVGVLIFGANQLLLVLKNEWIYDTNNKYILVGLTIMVLTYAWEDIWR